MNDRRTKEVYIMNNKTTLMTEGSITKNILFFSILLLTFADPLMRMFTADDAVVAVGKAAMRYFCPFYFLLSILHGLA